MTAVELGRRRVPRRAFEFPVGLLVHGTYTVERAYQIGEGGMLLSCSSGELSAGTQVVASFFMPTASTVIVRGVIRNVEPAKDRQPARYGIEFVNLEFQYKREIRNYVASASVSDAV